MRLRKKTDMKAKQLVVKLHTDVVGPLERCHWKSYATLSQRLTNTIDSPR